MLEIKFGDDPQIELLEHKFLVYLINNKKG